ncbi:EAL domain-containing protein [Klebsiella pneumoniae]|uniref:EAL domain-containing protein n=17 Tax=Gammaproteobacteria TaxID=1236 RepID=UPI00384B31A9
MAHDVPLGCAPDEYDDLISGTCSHLPFNSAKVRFIQQSHFGTGYSSLNYLREFPFDAIKLDRTFISGIAHVARDLSIVRSIVSLGKAFSLGIVAEGVENNEQFELLKNMNCDEFQGYYYSKPLSGDQLIDFLRGQKK